MLHDFPSNAPYFFAKRLRGLGESPASQEQALDRLIRLLPLLGDHVVPVWSSTVLPFHPVAISVFRDKQGQALVAAACETGLLAVTRADSGQEWSFLQIPHFWPNGGHILGLWASQALRPFGPWTELLILVAPPVRRKGEGGGSEGRQDPESRKPRLYRTLVRTVDGDIEIEPAREEIASTTLDSSRWESFSLPQSREWLGHGRVFCGGGADPFSPEGHRLSPEFLRDLEDSSDGLVAWGPDSAVRVEARTRLVSEDGEAEHVLDHPAQGVVCLPGSKPVRVLVITDRRRLLALERTGGGWRVRWQQPLRHRVTAVDYLPGRSRNGEPVVAWPDVFLCTSQKEVVRFEVQTGNGESREGDAERWSRRWETACRHLAEQAGLEKPVDWLSWCEEAVENAEGDGAIQQAHRRTLLYLAVDRLLNAPESLADPDLVRRCADLLDREKGDWVQQYPAVRRLVEALEGWAESGEGSSAVPDLIFVCYERLPYRLQEVFDSRLRQMTEADRKRHGRRSEGFRKLDRHAQNVVAFYEPPEPVRRVGTEVLRATHHFVSAGFRAPESAESWRLLAAPPGSVLQNRRLFAALGRKMVLFEIEEKASNQPSQSREVELRPVVEDPFPGSFHPVFARNLRRGEEWCLVVGSRQGKLLVFSWQALIEGQVDSEEVDLTGGELGAACTVGDSQLLVARQTTEGSEVVRLRWEDRSREFERTEWPTDLLRLQALAAQEPETGVEVLAGEFGDAVLMKLDGEGRLREKARRHLGSTVVSFTPVPDKSRVVCGTRNGHLFALDLDPSEVSWKRIAWIQFVPQGTALAIPGFGGSGQLGIVGGQGSVHVLNAEGTLLFHHSPPDPAEAAVYLDGSSADGADHLVAISASGAVTLLRRDPDRKKYLDRASHVFDQGGGDGEGAWHEAGEIGQVYKGLFIDGRGLFEVYAAATTRAGRRSAIRLAVERTKTLRNCWRKLLSEARLEDVALFLRLLAEREQDVDQVFGDGQHEWEQVLRDRLFGEAGRLVDAGSKLDEKTWPLVMALFEFFRLARESEHLPLLIEKLRTLPIREGSTNWTAHLVAHRVITTVGRGVDDPKELLEKLLDPLARLPLPVTLATSTQVGGSPTSVKLEQVLRNLVQLGDAFHRKARPSEIRASLQDLAEDLAPWRERTDGVGLFAEYVDLLRRDERDFGSMLDLLERAGKRQGSGVLDHLVVRPLSRWLGRPAPQGASLATEEGWLLEERRRAESFDQIRQEVQGELERAFKPDPRWGRLFDELNRLGVELWREQLVGRLEAIRNEVRVRVKVVENRRPSPQEVELTLTLIPDSLRKVGRLGVELTLEGLIDEEGKPLVLQRSFGTFEPRRGVPPETVHLHGTTVGADQETIRLRQVIRWSSGTPEQEQQLAEDTDLELEAYARIGHTTSSPLPDALDAWGRRLQERVRASRSRVLFVVLDQELGREAFVHRMATSGEVVVDLDGALERLGPGRDFPRLLNTTNVLAALRGEAVPYDSDADADFAWNGPLHLVSRSDDLWFRLLTLRELSPVLRKLTGLFRGPAQRNPALVFFVSSRIARRLQVVDSAEGWGLSFLDAGRVEVGTEPVREEAREWLASGINWLTNDAADAVLRGLGGDLRLLTLARERWKGQSYDVAGIESKIDELLLSGEGCSIHLGDLQGLPPSAIHLLLLAALSRTVLRFDQVSAGMVATEEVRAWKKASGTHRPTGARLVGPGEEIDEATVSRLSSDLGRQQRQLRVSGYLPGGTVESTPEDLHGFRQLLDPDQVPRAISALARSGIVEEHGGVVRVLDPYRRVIRRRHRSHKGVELFRFLTGGASPFRDVPLGALKRVSPEVLQELQPDLGENRAEALLALSAAWQNLLQEKTVSASNLQQAIQRLTGFPARLLAGATGDGEDAWKKRVEGRSFLFGLGAELGQGHHRHYFLVLDPATASDRVLDQLLQEMEARAASDAADAGGRSSRDVQNQRGGGRRSRLLVLRDRIGQGLRERQWVELSADDVRDVFLTTDPPRELWARVRAQSGLVSLAPFQREGALPPGSPLFFGRQEEVDWILRHATERSVLIVGSRQIGKTSLLNRIRFELEKRRDLELIFIDLQGRGERTELRRLLYERSGAPDELRDASVTQLVDHLVASIGREGKTPMFLLNEVDFLIERDVELLRAFRGKNDANDARFLMTGYFQAAAATVDIKSPLYHWTSSPDGRAYIVLAELSDNAARGIVGLLEEPPLELEWEPAEDREAAIQEILRHSYRIPHLVQALCLGLVEHLEQTGRSRLRFSDVQEVAEDPRYSAWDFVTRVDLGELVQGAEKVDEARQWVELLLLLAVKQRYYRGHPPPIQQNIRDRDPRSLSFTASDLRRWFPTTVAGLYRDTELARAERSFERLDLASLLQRLSLTLLLSWHPETRSHYFQSHLYPLEIHRQLREGETIDDRIIETALRLIPFLAPRRDELDGVKNTTDAGDAGRIE